MELTQAGMVAIAVDAALRYGLDPALVCAICEQECGDRKPDAATGMEKWGQWAIRHEPGYQAKYEVPLHLADTEMVARSTSWGLMQLMGESARELKYTGPLAQILEPSVGLDLGCHWFKLKLTRAMGDVPHALLLWNGGGDETYDEKVLARVEKYRRLFAQEAAARNAPETASAAAATVAPKVVS